MINTEGYSLAEILEQVGEAAEKAQYIMNDISERYFEAFNPDDSDGKFGIMYEFKRQRVFSRILADLINDICDSIRIGYINTCDVKHT